MFEGKHSDLDLNMSDQMCLKGFGYILLFENICTKSRNDSERHWNGCIKMWKVKQTYAQKRKEQIADV